MGTEKHPWWQMTKTSRQGFWMAGLYAAPVLICCLLLLAGIDVGWGVRIVAGWFTAMALAYVASSLAMRRSTRGAGEEA